MPYLMKVWAMGLRTAIRILSDLWCLTRQVVERFNTGRMLNGTSRAVGIHTALSVRAHAGV